MNSRADNFIFGNNLEKHYLYNDIIILKEKGFLTSRLSIVLYRKALFNINATITEIGRYFNKILGIKSQTIDLIKISKDSSVNYNILSKTKVKAYNLNIKAKSENEIKLFCEKFRLEIIDTQFAKGWSGKYWRTGDRYNFPIKVENIENANIGCFLFKKIVQNK